MPRTYEPIASTTLGADAASIEFTSIGGTFTDLRAVYVVRSTVAATSTTPNFRFNGATSSSTLHSITGLSGNGTAASSWRISSGIMQVENIYAASATSGLWSVVTIDVMSYANTNVYKTALVTVSTPGYYVSRMVGLFRSTSAITAMSFQGNSGNLLSGSTASLFGIKAA